MIALDTRLAQEIVTRTMQIIPFNVNVMDAHGTILGSGERARIGEQHAGAQLAIAQGRTVEVDAAAVRYLAGARPGVNLLLTVRGQTCGVVGLTGEPDAVRQFGELVRMTAEMILEQNLLNRDLQRDARYREEFVLQLLDAGAAGDSSLTRWASRLDIDLNVPRVAIVICPEAGASPDVALAVQQQCQQRLAQALPAYLTASRSATELVILAPVTDAAPELAGQVLESLGAFLGRECSHPLRMAMGTVFCGAGGAASSYQSALATMQVAVARKLGARQWSYFALRLPVLLSTLAAGWQAEQLREPLARLDAVDRHGALRTTLKAWFAADMNLSTTAKKLYLHRNTVDYRLRQIGAMTGLDLDKTDDRFLLYVALQLE